MSRFGGSGSAAAAWAAMVVAAATVCACFESGSGGSDATAGTDPAGETGTPAAGGCKAFCDMADANLKQCDMYAGQCMTQCAEQKQMADGKGGACKEANDSYLACGATKGLHCMDYQIDYMPCRSEKDHTYNYCNGVSTPDTPCMAVPVFDVACTGGTPKAYNCRGNVPAGCVVGGTNNNSDMYCCPS
ncbi:MAG: hypothetical protein FJ087_08860 [Deltaproteobacteria bacterium]|nr:hypothetical protein [Deltaproteobacteria bacterium]